jgi:hypothetical protein
MEWKIAALASARVVEVVPSPWMSSVLSVDHRFSVRTLSWLSPVEPVEGAMLASR